MYEYIYIGIYVSLGRKKEQKSHIKHCGAWKSSNAKFKPERSP